MSLDSLTSKVIVEFKGETSDLKRALRDLQGEERKLAEAQLAATEQKNKALDGHIKWIGRAGLALGVAATAAKVAFDAIEKYGKHLDLVSASGTTSIEGLGKAALGLKTNMELLEHAAVLNKSAFKLTQGQMETAERAMYVLEERGKSSEEVWSAVSTALTKGTTRSLEGLGIIIDKTGLSMDEGGLKMDTYGQKAKAVERIMSALAQTADEAKDGQLDAADKVQATTVKLKNYWDQAILKIGELATKLAPVIDMLAQAVGLVGTVVGKAGEYLGFVAKWAASPLLATKDFLTSGKTFDEMRADYMGISTTGRYRGLTKPVDDSIDIRGGITGAINKFGDVLAQAVNDPWRHAGLNGEKGGKATMPGYALGGTEYGMGSFPILEGQGGYSDISSSISGGMLSTADRDWKAESQTNADYNQYQQSKLAAVFGPIEDFDLYAKGFQMLQGAVGSALGAWIDGSASAGQAFRKFVAEAVKSISIQMAMEALKHGAYAIGSLAFGDFRGAAMHGKAAALHAAGSVAAAVAAKQLGSSGGNAQQGSGGYSPSAPASTGVGGSGGGSQTAVVVFGQDYENDSARQRGLRAAKALEAAKQSGAINGAITYA